VTNVLFQLNSVKIKPHKMSEAKKSHVITNIVHSTHTHPQLHEIINENKFSSLKELVTTLGYVYRFINQLLRRIGKNDLPVSNDRELSTEEYKAAFDMLFYANASFVVVIKENR